MISYYIGFQESYSLCMLDLLMFYDMVMLVISGITAFVLGRIFFIIFYSYQVNRFFVEDHMLEFIWTLLPALILFILSFPSIIILYNLSCELNTRFSVKAIGNQWFWRYDYGCYSGLDYDSYMLTRDSLPLGGFRLLEVDNRLVLPVGVLINILTRSVDVIHSWAIPSLGLKLDAVPGRLNQISVLLLKPGIYYGQCSEICGVNHRFIPIVVEGVSVSIFIDWYKNKK